MREILKTVSIEPTNACNLNCPICVDDKTRRAEFLSLGELRTILSTMYSRAPVHRFDSMPEVRLFLSGEPFLNDETPAMIKEVSNWGMDCLVHTNGILFTPDISRELTYGCRHHHNTTISFSLDGGTPERYAKTRSKPEDFEKVIQNIRNFTKDIDESECEGLQVTVQAILTDEDYKEYGDKTLNEYSDMFPNTMVSVRPPHSWNQPSKSVKGSVEGAFGPLCQFLFQTLVIQSNGQIGICCACLNGERELGRINEFDYDPWKAFKSEGLRDMRRRMKAKEEIYPCSNCERYSHE